jgi:hypothetical protein
MTRRFHLQDWRKIEYKIAKKMGSTAEERIQRLKIIAKEAEREVRKTHNTFWASNEVSCRSTQE